MRQGEGVALNPSGKPQTAQEAAYAAEMQRAGNLMNADRAKMVQEMAAAKARTGGK